MHDVEVKRFDVQADVVTDVDLYVVVNDNLVAFVAVGKCGNLVVIALKHAT